MEKEVTWLLQEKFGGKLTAAAKRDIKRLKKGEPLDHIIGYVDFLGCKILVNKDVLIPRFETEFWVEQVIENWKLKIDNLRILDMFAGSGCIGISILRQWKNTHVTFADSEKEALVQIKKSIKINKLGNSYELVSGDIFENVKGTFDYIFANPPYIPIENKNKIQESVVDFEPHVALFGGKDGLEVVRRFLAAAKNRLTPGGKIFMEFDSPQKPAIAKILKKEKYSTWDFHRDQYGKWRYVVIQ